MRNIILLAGYACFAYWGCRKLAARSYWKELTLFVVLIVYCAGTHLAAMRSWPEPTLTRLSQTMLLPAGRWLYTAFRSMM